MIITRCIYTPIYSFHMHALVFISGYFSKNALQSKNYPYKLVKSLLIPFVLANLLMWTISSRSIGSIFNPGWTLWYLLSLFFWRMLVAPFSKIRFSILISLLLSLCIGLSSATQLLSISRTVAFFPVFLVGYKVSGIYIERIRKINKIAPMLLMIIILAFVINLRLNNFPAYEILAMDRSYASIEGITKLQGVIFRFIALLAGTLSTFCLLIIIPTNQTIASFVGERTMTIYLGHSFFIIGIKEIANLFFPTLLSNEWSVILLSLVLSIFICMLFCNRWIIKIYNIIIDRLSMILLLHEEPDTEK